MGARIVRNDKVVVVVAGAGEDPLADLIVDVNVDVDLAGDGGLPALVDEGRLDRLLLARHGGRGEVRGGMLVVFAGRPEALVLLLSIGEGEPREEDQSKCQEVLALGSDMARRPSQHLGDNNVDVWGN